MSGQPPPFPPGQMPPGMQRPTPEQIAEIQRRVAEDAQKAGMSVPDFIEHIKRQAMEQQRMRAQQQQQQQQHDHDDCDCGHDHDDDYDDDHHHDHDHDDDDDEHEHGPNCNHDHHSRSQPITPGPPNPKALAVAKFLRGQDLKLRTCILNGERKDMFKGMWPRNPSRAGAC